jgi:hypothetical protein
MLDIVADLTTSNPTGKIKVDTGAERRGEPCAFTPNRAAKGTDI